MIVVEIDAVYTKAFTTRVILIALGQTPNVLVRADQPPSRYFKAARPFMDAPVPVDNKTAHYFNIKGVFRIDFPDHPPIPFNYTGVPLTANLGISLGIRLSKVAFNSTIELVLQDTNLLTVESHPFHLHGFNFFVVGSGVGNFNPSKDRAKFNLVDPPKRNTVGGPTGGWIAIRFRADNPRVWLMHCHLELHTMWGLNMAFVVENGQSPKKSIVPPPRDLPPC
ncbi:hypothetical protein QUC31_011050 [Theobroma cacao]